jgi:hypothetical protein
MEGTHTTSGPKGKYDEERERSIGKSTAFSTDGARPPCCPPRHRTPPQPCAGRLAVRPAGRTQAAGRLTRRSCLGLGDRPQTAASRSETLPRWARGSEQQARRGERLIQTHEVTVVNALAHAEACRGGLSNAGTASIVVARASFKRVRACRTRPRQGTWQGTWHTGSRGARWGDADAGRPGLPSHAPCAGRRQTE